jgi:hypothetical protein
MGWEWQVLDDDESQSISFQEICIQIKKLVCRMMCAAGCGWGHCRHNVAGIMIMWQTFLSMYVSMVMVCVCVYSIQRLFVSNLLLKAVHRAGKDSVSIEL